MKIFKRYSIIIIFSMIFIISIRQLGATGSLLWLLFLIWGFIIILFVLLSFSKTVDDEWASKRADELVDNSYDVHHIEGIRERRTRNINKTGESNIKKKKKN